MIHSERARNIARRGTTIIAIMAGGAAMPLFDASTTATAAADPAASAMTWRHDTGRPVPGVTGAAHPVRQREEGADRLTAVVRLPRGWTRAPRGKALSNGPHRWPYRVTNNGREPVRRVVFSVTLPRDLLYVSASRGCSLRGRRVVCRLGVIGPGRTKRGGIATAVAPRARPSASSRPKAELTWRSAGKTRKQAVPFPKIDIAGTGDLSVVGKAPRTVRPNGLVTYQITVTNHGPARAKRVVISDRIDGRRLLREVGGARRCRAAGSRFVCAIGDLAAGRKRTIKLVARAADAAHSSGRSRRTMVNRVSVRSATPDLRTADNTAVVRTRVAGPEIARLGLRAPIDRTGTSGASTGAGSGSAHRSGGGHGSDTNPGLGSGHGSDTNHGSGPGHGPALPRDTDRTESPGADSKRLPATGSRTMIVAAAAAGLIGIGLLLLTLARRSQRLTGGSPDRQHRV